MRYKWSAMPIYFWTRKKTIMRHRSELLYYKVVFKLYGNINALNTAGKCATFDDLNDCTNKTLVINVCWIVVIILKSKSEVGLDVLEIASSDFRKRFENFCARECGSTCAKYKHIKP